ncbi:PasA protein [Pseudomonas syringae]|nr:PasA protein [Pseudomonas syringae]MBD8576843.1 PasA protein [Pseudomonas syringae]MBD8788832.1 PasA protein [Pseudomonas syringae]MBD8803069.1 PasA protein [Pseudomonas syringae]MBD8813779.1 PasA protein [Pseudomonas syringae]
MAQERYTRTNQKIYFAGLALQALNKAEQGQAINAQAQVQAEREAVLFHLYGALLGLCHEIAGYYRLPQANAPRAEQLLSPQVIESVAIPELGELIELAQNSPTWVARLLAAYGALFEPPREIVKPKGDVTQPMIVAVNLDREPEPELDHDELESWRQSLKALAVRYREGLNEF